MLIAETEFNCNERATQSLNRSFGSASERCECAVCRNFVANKQSLFSKLKLSTLLSNLGLTEPFDNETFFAAPSESEALYGTIIYVVGQSNLPPHGEPETTSVAGMEISISDGVALHHLDEGIRYSFSRSDKMLAPEIPNDTIHELELHLFLPWLVDGEMPEFNPHLR